MVNYPIVKVILKNTPKKFRDASRNSLKSLPNYFNTAYHFSILFHPTDLGTFQDK